MNFKHVLAVTVATFGVVAAAQEYDLDKAAAWTGKVDIKDDVLVVKGKQGLTSSAFIPVDPAKTYEISFKIRSTSAVKARTYIGFYPYNAQKQMIQPRWVNAIANADGTLAEACKKTDTVMKIKFAKPWPKLQAYHTVAFDAKADRSDLPNTVVAGGYVKSSELKDGVLTVTFTRPIGVEKAAGTAVRAHADGGYMYAYAEQPTDQWKEVKVYAGGKGMKWWPGTKFVRVLVFGNWDNPQGAFEIKDFEVEVK